MKIREIQWLHEVGGGSESPRGDCVFQGAVRSDDDDGNVGCLLAGLLEDFEAADVWQADVEEDEACFGEACEAFASACAKFGGVAEFACGQSECGCQRRFVFDDENHDFWTGNVRMTAAPVLVLVRRRVPLEARTISETTLRPIPIPPSFSL